MSVALPALVLASASPRRAELLRSAGLDFRVLAPNADESASGRWPAAMTVLVLARRKAEAVVPRAAGATHVLAADTLVVAPDGTLVGKPRDPADAARILRLLSGATHRVVTGVVVLRLADHRGFHRAQETRVTFRVLTDDEIAAYVATAEPMGKAGAYAVQGQASGFVSRIEGDESNVVGLPMAVARETLAEAGYALPSAPPSGA